MTQTKLAKQKPAKPPLRQRITLSLALTWTVGIAIAGAGLTAGYYALTVLHENKLVDTWAILFLELEQQGSRISKELSKIEVAEPQIILQPDVKSKLRPIKGLGRPLDLIDLGFSAKNIPKDLPLHTIVELGGERYKMQWLPDEKIGLSRVSTGIFAKIINAKKNDEAYVYLTTREGRMLYSNDKDITSANFASRPLVQDFIQTPLAQGQTEFNDAKGVRFYGFFKDIGDTNLILFAEVERSKALASVRAVIVRFLAVLAGIMFFFVVALQISLGKIIGPLKDLVQLAGQIGRGNFAVEFGTAGVGEVMSLNNAFRTMVGNLVERDRSIQKLMAEQLEKIRLEGELKIAQGIQANLLPADRLPEELGLDVFAKYIPATECAGDWYGYHHNPSANETIITIADVSGHGAGSSMFTAMIAGLFDQHKSTSKGPWDIEKFTQDVNGVILRLGRRQWHATMLVLRYRHATQDADLLFAGHNPPFIQHSTEDISMRRLRGSSSVLGLEEQATYFVAQVPFKSGTTMLMFTDGLVEAANPTGKKLGDKKVLKTFQSVRTDSATQIVNRVVNVWDQHRAGTPAADDMCVMAIRVAS